MDNRDRDKLSKSTGSTEAGDINRETSKRKGESSSDSDASFGQNIGRSENWDQEPSRRSSSDEGSSESVSSSDNSSRGSSGRMREH